jgi:hypothetical protein
VGRQIIRLYKQFAAIKRVKRIAGENGDVELHAFSENELSNDDLVFDTANELEETTAGRKSMLIEMLKMGLLTDENGALSSRTKTRVFEILGFGNWENSRDIDELHQKKAQRENALLVKRPVYPDTVDNHALHIDEHTKALITKSASENAAIKQRMLDHINSHKELTALAQNVLGLEQKLAAADSGNIKFAEKI